MVQDFEGLKHPPSESALSDHGFIEAKRRRWEGS